jgi:hypothetical protein
MTVVYVTTMVATRTAKSETMEVVMKRAGREVS